MNIENRYDLDIDTGCWNWNGATKRYGYGYLTVGSRTDGSRRTKTAHRASYEHHIGPIPDGLWVLHKCDNPRCINPDHLYIGDRARNVLDMVERGRRASDTGESNNNSKIREEDVIAIRKERAEKGSSYRSLAKKYGLASHKSVMQICAGTLWPHVKPEPPK